MLDLRWGGGTGCWAELPPGKDPPGRAAAAGGFPREYDKVSDLQGGDRVVSKMCPGKGHFSPALIGAATRCPFHSSSGLVAASP